MANNNNAVVREVLKDSLQKETFEIIRYNFQELKQAAIKYTQYVLHFRDSLKILNRALRESENAKTTKQDLMKNISVKVQNSKIFAKNMYLENLKFRTVLEGFLGRKMPLTIVNQDGSMIVLTEIEEEKLYKKYLISGVNARGKITQIEQAIQDIVLSQNSLTKALNNRLNNFKTVFTEAKRRAGKEEKEMNFSPSARHVYYRLWDKRHITGWYGPIKDNQIAQVYAETVLNRRYIKASTQFILAAMGQIYSLERQQEHNWDPAVTGGDVSIAVTDQGNINLSLAIKLGPQFHLEGIKQYILAAFNISLISNITKQQLSPILGQLSRAYSPAVIKKIIQTAGGKVIQQFNKKSFAQNLKLIKTLF